ncbi:uncharacterized protein EDB93DRAFT_1088176, partial [Suillus bovinus]|uniref:uncharacterized protein n=1 Tax=Suillus bovinus TaxID=48563 RepID=UPI001B878171
FSPQVSAALKGDVGRNITTSLQRSSILVSAALRVMHPDLYRAGIKTQYQLQDIYHHLKHWASVFNVVSVIFNHQSPPHRDPKC